MVLMIGINAYNIVKLNRETGSGVPAMKDMYLNQISLTGGIPFAVSLPKAPQSVNADLMSVEEIHTKLQEGYEDVKAGRVQDAAAAFAKFTERH